MLNLAEVLENYSQVIGTISIKYLADFESDDNDIQAKLRQITDNLLFHIHEIVDNDSFNSLIADVVLCEEGFGAYISMLDKNKDLVIQYSSDSSLINMVSSDQDQVSYDLGIITFKSETVDILPSFKISTLITPISVRI